MPFWKRTPDAPTPAAQLATSRGSAAAADLGLQMIEALREDLGIGPDETIEIERGFKWWPSMWAQTFQAAPVEDLGSGPIARVRLSTEILRTFESSANHCAVLSEFALRSALGAFVIDAGTIRMTTSVTADEESFGAMRHVMGVAAMVQSDCAELLADAMAEMTSSEVAVSGPPWGPRADQHSLLDASRRQIVPIGKRDSLFSGDGLDAAAQWARDHSGTATVRSGALTCAIPYVDSPALLKMETGTPSVLYGNGVRATLMFPVAFSDLPVYQIPQMFNELEAREPWRIPSIGTWCWLPDGLGHVTFVPNVCAFPDFQTTLVSYEWSRTQWAKSLLGPSGRGSVIYR